MSDKTTDQLEAELAHARATIQNQEAALATSEERADSANKQAAAALQRAERAEERASALLADAQEREQWKARAEVAESSVATLEAVRDELLADKVDSILAAAYKSGTLIRAKDAAGESIASPREARLRKIAKNDGVEALEAELSEMSVAIPSLGRAVLDDRDPNPRPSGGPIPREVLDSTAAQLEIEPTELAEYATGMKGGAS